MKIDLGGGQSAELYSATEMPRRVSARLEDMLADAPEELTSWQYLRQVKRMRDTLIAMVIKEWSYGEPPGDNPEDVYDLPQGAYDKLLEETKEHWKASGFTASTEEDETETKPAKTRKPTTRSTSSA